MPTGATAAKGNPRSSGYERAAGDWYVEPPWAVRDLLDAEMFDGMIWDPSCGRGTIPRVCAERGLPAIGSDLADRDFGTPGRDFFTCPDVVPNIICNPPYNVIGRWMAHALRSAHRKVAIFAPLELLGGQERGRWWPTTPLARVWVFSCRVPCPPGTQAPLFDVWDRRTIQGARTVYAWFVFQHGHAGAPSLGFLPLSNRKGGLV